MLFENKNRICEVENIKTIRSRNLQLSRNLNVGKKIFQN